MFLSIVETPMYFRSILSGTLAILLVSSAIVQADDRVGLLNSLKPDTAETKKTKPRERGFV